MRCDKYRHPRPVPRGSFLRLFSLFLERIAEFLVLPPPELALLLCHDVLPPHFGPVLCFELADVLRIPADASGSRSMVGGRGKREREIEGTGFAIRHR